MLGKGFTVGLAATLWTFLVTGIAARHGRAHADEEYVIEVLPVLVANDDGTQGPDPNGPDAGAPTVSWRDWLKDMVDYANLVYGPHDVFFSFDDPVLGWHI